MQDPPDYELEKDPQTAAPPPPPPSSAPSLLWIAAAIVLALAAGAYFYLNRTEAPLATDAEVVTEEAVPPSGPLGAEVEPIELPPLDQTDAVVRDLVRKLSSHPRVAAWLTTNGLIRNFVVVVDNIASGATPSGHLRVLKPEGAFQVADANGVVVVDPRSYRRYDDLAAAVASIDAGGAARLYSMLKPRIEDAYRELGQPGSFDQRLETAIVRLLETPVIEGEVSLEPRGALYVYNDPRIERLTQAQKQLVRMGPRNVRTIQRKLREIALVLGIPAARLPGR